MALSPPECLAGVQTVAQREAALLAPYAMHSSATKGRNHPEEVHPYRGPFQRDRDRILHSGAYRRLSGKTQVFTNVSDYHRTRLTHTQEVASISRTIGRALRLNEDLVEALALIHDIGHPPYGHAGEDALNECLQQQGGFSHNQHALTIVEELEKRYHAFPGLNLSREILEGQAFRVDKRADLPAPLLEVQVVDAADSITYDAHDTDDAIKLGILSIEQLAEIPLIRSLLESLHPRVPDSDPEMLRLTLVHGLIEYQVSDVLKQSGEALEKLQNDDALHEQSWLVGTSSELAAQKRELESFLYNEVYRHPKLLAVRAEAQQRIQKMFAGFLQHPEWLPAKLTDRIAQVGRRRGVGEYLAGMTDRYCDQVFDRYFA